MSFEPRSGLLLAGVLMLILNLFTVSTAFAQATPGGSDCILDNCADKKPGPSQRSGAQPRGPSIPGAFGFYVLSLSWSSGFCETKAPDKASKQCDAGANLGFVVHGLWPQYEQGFPSDCGPAGRTPSRTALDGTKDLFPDEGLARYEWRRHGTCSGKSPTDYFADVRKARAAIVIPQPFREAKQGQTWTPVDIQRAFLAANPKLQQGMLAVSCKSGILQDVRICFSKDLQEFRACPEVSRQFCRTREVSVPAMR